MIKKSISHLGIFLLGVLSLLPLPVLYLLADATYVLLYRVFAYRKNVVRENLLLALPEKSLTEIIQIEKKFFRYLSSLIFEILKMNTISSEQIKKRFIFHNKSQLQEYLDRGESVLVCSAHYGNWEWGTLSIGLSYKGDSYPIYKPLSNKAFDQWFNHIRTRFGNKLIAMRQTYRAITETRNTPTLFLFGNDQAPPKEESHQWMTFLNQQTSVQQGMEKIAIKTNRPVFYLKSNVIKKGYYLVECIPLCLDPAASTQQEITALHTCLLETIIREKPEYWLWSHKRWKHQPTQ